MRKFGFLFVVFALIIAVAPAFAQDEMGTIADVVIASTEAETPEFTILLAAVQAADPAVVEALSAEGENWTVFAPTDAAFEAALADLGVSAEDLLADTEALTEILLYHVVPFSFSAEDVIALDGAVIGTALNETAISVALDGENVVINGGSTVVAADVEASNGIVHVIDAVLLPPAGDDMMEEEMMEEGMEDYGDDMMAMGSIAEVVVASTEAETPEFTVLLAAVQAADPAVIAELSEGGPFTVFAPTDEAFAAALEALGVTAEDLLADTEALTEILLYHVVPGHFEAATVTSLEDGTMVATALGGSAVTLGISDMGVMVDGANVVATDVHASNGIVHVIDAVILPEME